MSSRLPGNVGRIVRFPTRGKSKAPVGVLRVVVPVVAVLTWQILQGRKRIAKAPTTDKATQATSKIAAKGTQATSKATSKGAQAAHKATPKRRRSSRYYAVTALITALENPTSRKLVIGGLKLLRNFL